MPAKRSIMFEITEYFRTAELSSAKEMLAMCREVVKGREPKVRRPRVKRTAADEAEQRGETN